jgi:DNA-binding SARP family transcriptional activator
MPTLRLELLGSPQITLDGEALPRLVSSKAPALLSYLAVTGRAHTRASLAALLWGELPEADAAMNLRTVLASLRRVVGEHLLISRQSVTFNHAASHWLDVDRFQTIVQHPAAGADESSYRQLGEAVMLYRGDFLEGFAVRNAPAFEEWALRQREWLRRLAVHGLQVLADHHAARAELPQAIASTNRLLALEPWQEEAHRQLMRLYLRGGQRSAALVQYETCRRLLSAELGIEPDAETRALYEQIRRGEFEGMRKISEIEERRPPAADEAAGRAALPSPGAERRQISVLTCAPAGILQLSQQLDPEALHELLRLFQRACDDAIAPFEGRRMSHNADRLLVAFGYPSAHEDDALRAVHSALGIVAAVGRLNTLVQQRFGVRLAALVGVHTGQVVMGGGSLEDDLVGLAGETPGIAARLLELELRDTVLISAATQRLLQGMFSCQALSPETLRASLPVSVLRVLHPSQARSRLEAAIAAGLTPLVGREQELGMLLERWRQVSGREGQGQAVLLSGEAGIGKSRLVQVLKQRVGLDGGTWLECRCSPFHQQTPLYPVIDMLQRVIGFAPDDTPAARLRRIEAALSSHSLALPDTLPALAELLGLSAEVSEEMPQALGRTRTLHALADALLVLAQRQPLLLIFEDLHWVDELTLELIGMLVDQGPTTAICTLLTARAEFRSPWAARTGLTQLTLGRLARHQVQLMVEQLCAGRQLGESVLRQIVERTDGVPLFVEELTRVLLESPGSGEGSAAEPCEIPATLQDSLAARLDRLGRGKQVAQIGAAIGREFPYALLRALAPLDEETLRAELARLVEAELLYQRGLLPQATFIFRHALIQEAAYSSLLRTTQQHLQRQIAAARAAQASEAPGLAERRARQPLQAGPLR